MPAWLDRLFPPILPPQLQEHEAASDREPPLVDADGLRSRVGRLEEERRDLQWDLGGAAYEMAIRDHFRLDVLVRQAARLQEVDAELAELRRMLVLEEQGAAGACPRCAALHSAGAGFCWRCGTRLLEPGNGHVAHVDAPDEQPTAH